MSSTTGYKLDEVNDVATEEQELREKVDTYKCIINKLNSEVQQNAISKVGVETLTKLLQESRTDLNKEQKKARSLEAAVTELQKRLTGSNISGDVEIDELYIPGPSKHVLDNLVRENTRLRRLVNDVNGDPEEVKKLKQVCIDLQNSYNILSAEKEAFSRRIEELQNIITSSDSEKDAQILNLHKLIQKMRKKEEAHNIITESLTKELKALRQELPGLGERCNNVMMKIDEKERVDQDRHQLRIQPTQQENEKMQALVQDFKNMQLKNEQLINKIDEVEEMNSKWRMYSDNQKSMAQERFTSLQSNIKEYEDQYKGKCGHLDEILAQKLQVETEMEELKRVHDARMKERIGSPISGHGPNGQATQEDINALKQQIKICTEDFVSERKDKETALKKVQELQALIKRKSDEISGLSPYQKFQMENAALNANNQTPRSLLRQPQTDTRILAARGYHSMMVRGYDEPDAPLLQTDGGQSEMSRDGQCPICGTTFEHNNLEEHISKCNKHPL